MRLEPTHIYALGPEGTFSDQAAQRLRAKFTGEAPPGIKYTRTIPEVLLRSEAEHNVLGVVPIENSVAGTVTQAQDIIARHQLTVIWEIQLRVRYSLLVRGGLSEVEVYFAHPQAYEQCSQYLATHLSQGQVIFSNSNTESGEKLLAETTRAVAAIVPIDYGAEHPGLLVAENIQNVPHNTTRFLVVRRKRADEDYDFTRNKISLLVEPDTDRPGLLHEVLTIFNRHKLNLCRLESRPDTASPWTYLFYIDFNNNSRSAACLEELEATPNRITVLGSYDLLE